MKSYYACQRIGKNRDWKKAPMQLVSIISEVFAKLNIDAVGLLPISNKNIKYLIVTICVVSKYPVAMPKENVFGNGN